MPAEVTLQQAVFGYDAGHNLLSASCTLSSESRRTLAVLTDASGSWPVSGFDHVFTGTPLPDMPLYAVFCTWPAPEMPRPGCVWSHVLLVELADLAAIADLSELRRCFRRPTGTGDAKYDKPLHFTTGRDTPEPVAPSREADCSRILEALYVTPEVPCVVEAQSAETYSNLVFAIWSQQWPRLRRCFRFSTGSFADRGRSGPAFDLQISPEGSRRVWQQGAGQKTLNTASSPNANLKDDRVDWLNAAVNDLRAPDSHGFRSFLQIHGVDIDNPRGAFARLGAAYDLLVSHPRGEWMERLRGIGRLFPDRSEALRLKETVIAPQSNSTAEENLQHAWATASFLLNPREGAAYAGVAFDHAGVAPRLWKGMRDQVLSLLAQLVRQDENTAATAFASAIANTLLPSEVRLVADRHTELIPVLLSHRPSLAFDVDIWHLHGPTQGQIFEALSRLSINQMDWSKIMGAMFVAATYVAVREAVEKAGPYAMQGAFQWLEHGVARECLPSQAWREALAGPATKLLAGNEPLPSDQLALCAWCVPPETARQILSASRQDIQLLAGQPLEHLPFPLRVPTAFLLVTLGLRAKSDAGLKLVVSNFYPVHDALASRDYSSESWSLLSPELPYLGIWRNWDQCEKLRRAVHQWLAQHVKVGNPLLEVANTKERRELSRRVHAGDSSSSDEFID